jgi:hypothetical protein
MPDFNCECVDENDNLTLAQYRTRMLQRLGFAANATNPPPGMADMLTTFLQDAQAFLYLKYPALRTRRLFRWKLVQGERFYNMRGNDENWRPVDVELIGGSPSHVRFDEDPPADGTQIQLRPNGEDLPEGLDIGRSYYVLNGSNTDDWCEIATTPNGTPIEFTGTLEATALLQPAATCVFNMEPYKNIEGAWVEDVNGTWLPMAAGIPPWMYTTANQPSLPCRYEIRQCIEVFPAPNNSNYSLWIKGHFGKAAFSADGDKPTIDGQLVYLWALGNALDYYGKPAAAGVIAQAREHLGSLVAGTHGSRRYIPNTTPLPPAVVPLLAPYPGQVP